MNIRRSKHGFAPIIDENSKILILGSVPSVKSVESGFYYMNPQNRFWRTLSSITGVDFEKLSKEEKTQELLNLGIAIYDVVDECDVRGSSDSKISNATKTDIPSLIERGKIEKIFCNGKTAYRYFCEFYPELLDIASVKPSTSSANARFSLSDLVEEWKEIAEYI